MELAARFDISIGLTRAPIAEPRDGQPGRDRVSFFIFSRNEIAPVVCDHAVRGAASSRQPHPDRLPVIG
jgi:hypothetical protein